MYSMSSLKITNIHGPAYHDKGQVYHQVIHASNQSSSQYCPISFEQSLLSWLKFLVKISRLQASNKIVQEMSQCIFTQNQHEFVGLSHFCVLIRLGNLSLYSIWLSSDISLLSSGIHSIYLGCKLSDNILNINDWSLVVSINMICISTRLYHLECLWCQLWGIVISDIISLGHWQLWPLFLCTVSVVSKALLNWFEILTLPFMRQ